MPAAQLDVVTMDAIDWWSTYGSGNSYISRGGKESVFSADQ